MIIALAARISVLLVIGTITPFVVSCASIIDSSGFSSENQISTDTIDKANHLLDDYTNEFPALNVSVTADGEVVWENTVGGFVTSSDGPLLDYNIYSVSKMITGMAFAR